MEEITLRARRVSKFTFKKTDPDRPCADVAVDVETVAVLLISAVIRHHSLLFCLGGSVVMPKRFAAQVANAS